MKKQYAVIFLSALGLLLSGCGKDFNEGFGEYDAGITAPTKGFGGYTKGYADKEVGLCSYTGGCMPESDEDDGPKIGAPKKKSDAGDGSSGE